MSEPDINAATAHLKTIRALMERATVYRALSAPAALVAGILTLLVCGVLLRQEPSARLSPVGFTWLWIGVLVVVTGFNFGLLQRSARRRGDPFASAGMKLALRAVAPPLTAGFVLALLAATRTSHYTDVVSSWILFYGLGLLAMGSFAPKSLLVLGMGFFVCGLLSFHPAVRAMDGRQWQSAVVYMAITFGGLHVIYALYVFAGQRHLPEPDPPGHD